jgi:hypothetical protein
MRVDMRNKVLCNNGTYDITNGVVAPCESGGGVKNQPVENAPQYKTQTQGEPESDLQYYTSAKFLKRASYSIIPVALIGGYSYYKKFSLLKSALLVSIPIVAITGLQYIGMGGGKNKYWGIFIPPSVSAKKYAPKQIKK